jgi:hypothetical protein
MYGDTDYVKSIWSIVNNRGTNSGFSYGIESMVWNWGTNNEDGSDVINGSIASAVPIRAKVQNAATGAGASTATMTNVTILDLSTVNSSEDSGGTAVITNAYGLKYWVSNIGTDSTITNNYDIYLAAPSNSGTITNHYGLYMEDQTVSGSTLNYAIYIAGGKSYFGGNTEINGTLKVNTGGSTNHAVCWKSGNIMGYCSTVIGSDGTCTCN